MTEETKKFKELYEMPCEGHTEKKGNLTYLSWAYAWATLLEQDPTATKKVYENADGSLVWKDPIGAHVKVSVTAFGTERIEYLPVMDYNNRSITLDKIDSMAVNKTVQRAVTKAIAQFGIGLKLYAGEDLETADDKEDPLPPYKAEEQFNEQSEERETPKTDYHALIQEQTKRFGPGEYDRYQKWLDAKFHVTDQNAVADEGSLKTILACATAVANSMPKGGK